MVHERSASNIKSLAKFTIRVYYWRLIKRVLLSIVCTVGAYICLAARTSCRMRFELFRTTVGPPILLGACSSSLITTDRSRCSYSFHPSVYFWNRDKMSDEDRKARCRSTSALSHGDFSLWTILSGEIIPDLVIYTPLKCSRCGNRVPEFGPAYDESSKHVRFCLQ